MVRVAVLNKPKIRMNSRDSKVFLFSSCKEIKTDRKKNAAHAHNANADVGCLNHTLHYLFHHSPWLFLCFRRFFSKLLLSFNGFLFSFSLIVFFCLGFLRPFNYFCHVRFRCFLFVFLVTPFGVRVCYVGYIVFYGLASTVHYREDPFYSRLYPQFTYMIFI